MDIGHYEEVERLKHDLVVTIRAIRPGDKAGIAEAFGKLDADSIYTRFFSAKKSLSEPELKAATEVDFEDVVALVVTIPAGGREVIIGGGRYIAFDQAGTRSAEIAFIVEEDYHGRGIAGCILKHLARIARAKGVGQFEAEVLGQNKAMLAVFSRRGLPMKLTQTASTFHVALSLADGSERTQEQQRIDGLKCNDGHPDERTKP